MRCLRQAEVSHGPARVDVRGVLEVGQSRQGHHPLRTAGTALRQGTESLSLHPEFIGSEPDGKLARCVVCRAPVPRLYFFCPACFVWSYLRIDEVGEHNKTIQDSIKTVMTERGVKTR